MPTAIEEILGTIRALPSEDQRHFVAALLALESTDLDLDAVLRAELAERDRIEVALLESQQQLAEANHMLRLVVDTIPVRVFWKDRELRFLGANQLFAEDAGEVSPDSLVGRTDRDLVWQALADRYEADDLAVIETGKARIDYEEPQTRPNGQARWIRTTKAPLRTRTGTTIGVLGTYEDVTERRRLQQRLHDAEHIEAVAQLAGGIAHDFNNLLTGILGNAELIRDDVDADSETAVSALEILRAARRAADLTQQLLAFARRGRLQSQPVDLHTVLAQTAKLSAHTGHRRLTVATRFQARRSIVVGDPTQLGNAFIDLARNASDAMPDGGELLFTTRDVVLSPEEAARLSPELRAGPYLEVRVVDSGVGIAPEIQPRIFEPFFTTKPPGAGSGLGLAAVFGCVKGHGGHVSVESAPARGTTILLLLPIGQGQARKSTPVSMARVPVESGRILVIDDEETVRAFVVRALTKSGYEVTAFPDGLAAVDYFAVHHAEIDLVILDLTMPHLSGEEAFHRLREIDPDVRVVIASGHSRQAAADALLGEGARAFLAKPFRAYELTQEVALHIRRPTRNPAPAAAG
ncbi:MAG: response regulator [Polyangiaceae bacterium]|nr:response regulator [Polyangiaceae bacterium]